MSYDTYDISQQKRNRHAPSIRDRSESYAGSFWPLRRRRRQVLGTIQDQVFDIASYTRVVHGRAYAAYCKFGCFVVVFWLIVAP